MHLYELSSRLLVDTVDKVNENLTSVVLAASLITLILGYVSKQRLGQSCDKDAVSELKGGKKTKENNQASVRKTYLYLLCEDY